VGSEDCLSSFNLVRVGHDLQGSKIFSRGYLGKFVLRFPGNCCEFLSAFGSGDSSGRDGLFDVGDRMSDSPDKVVFVESVVWRYLPATCMEIDLNYVRFPVNYGSEPYSCVESSFHTVPVTRIHLEGQEDTLFAFSPEAEEALGIPISLIIRTSEENSESSQKWEALYRALLHKTEVLEGSFWERIKFLFRGRV